jgi:hypothetical protein
MIWDSEPWKYGLLKSANLVSRWRKQTRWSEQSLFKVEREVFLGFYAIRKLLDAQLKLSFEARDFQTSVNIYKATGKKPDLMNWHKIEQCYDLTSSEKASWSVRQLCNTFVHSFIFIARTDKCGLHSIYFNTDRNRFSCLMEISAEQIEKIFTKIGGDEINELKMERDTYGEWQITKASSLVQKYTFEN